MVLSMVILSWWQSSMTPPRQEGPGVALGAGGKYLLSSFRVTVLLLPDSLLMILLYSAAAACRHNLNQFRYLEQVIGDSTTTKTLHERQDKSMEEFSIYNRQNNRKKETKNDVYIQNETTVGEWISLSLDKKKL